MHAPKTFFFSFGDSTDLLGVYNVCTSHVRILAIINKKINNMTVLISSAVIISLIRETLEKGGASVPSYILS